MSPPIWSLVSAFVIGSLTLSSASPLLPRHNDLCYPHLDGKSVSIVHEPIEIAFEGGPDGATFGSDLDNIDVNLSKTDFVLELVNKHDNGYIFKSIDGPPWVINTAGPSSGYFTLDTEDVHNIAQHFYIKCEKCDGHSKDHWKRNTPLATGCTIFSPPTKRCIGTYGDTGSKPFLEVCSGSDSQKFDFWPEV